MTEEKWARLKVGHKIKVTRDEGYGHDYEIGQIYTVTSIVGRNCQARSEITGRTGNNLRRTECEPVAISRNAKIKEFIEEIAAKKKQIEQAEAQVAFLKEYRDVLDATLAKSLSEQGITLKATRNAIYKALKEAGCPVDFDPPKPLVESLGGRLVAAPSNPDDEDTDDDLEF